MKFDLSSIEHDSAFKEAMRRREYFRGQVETFDKLAATALDECIPDSVRRAALREACNVFPQLDY